MHAVSRGSVSLLAETWTQEGVPDFYLADSAYEIGTDNDGATSRHVENGNIIVVETF